ncbi:MAG: PAS domain-containing protein [Alphaproteobacteria bacterium]|nr:PAS domain-containing protein [Alphaproteobacteria bacterium]
MDATHSPEERRITLRLLSYWEKRRGTRGMPSEAEMSPADIADLWPYCFIAHVKDIGKEGYHFSYLGKAIEDVYREGMEQMEDSLFPDMDSLANGYKQVISTRKPLVSEGEITNPHGDHFKFRQVLLPLGDGGAVQAVFGGMRFLRIVTYR